MSKPTKKVMCPAPGCWERRIHHERQDTPRGPQYIDVPEDWTPDKGIAFCSLSCAAYAGLRPINTRMGTGWECFVASRKAEFKLTATEITLTLPDVDAGWGGKPSCPITVTRRIGPGTLDPNSKKLREGMCWDALTLMRQGDNVRAARRLLKDVTKRIDTPMSEWGDYRTPVEILSEVIERLNHIDWWDSFEDESDAD